MKKMIVTGSSGLIGSEVVTHFARLGWTIYGVDNNLRADFFGPEGSTIPTLKRLMASVPEFTPLYVDIRDREMVIQTFASIRPDAVVHAAAQPSHDLAASRPFDDFDVNAVGTLNMLEAARRYCPEAPFVHMSTNKVYGDRPNSLGLTEGEKRFHLPLEHVLGINESMSIDGSLHSVFGASKVAADIMVQEYGRYFGMPTCCLRGGCLTGPAHSGVELHGFLSYLIKCNVQGRPYKVFGHKGKQVRDNIHSHDVAEFIRLFIESPRRGQVYNIGGGSENSTSILEAFERIEGITGKAQEWEYIDEARRGDHICYYSDLTKIKAHYPSWTITRSLHQIFTEIYETHRA